ncbi:hypothetical protein C8R46DRAFT_1101934, partial [Mycena filopes]
MISACCLAIITMTWTCRPSYLSPTFYPSSRATAMLPSPAYKARSLSSPWCYIARSFLILFLHPCTAPRNLRTPFFSFSSFTRLIILP